jgi:Mn-dependent DtxR family transcriptional regulator
LIHLSLGGFLFHFMTLPDRSVTLRILVEVLLAPGQALSTTDLSRRYGVKTMIASRLEQLSAARFIEISSDRRIALTRKGLSFGRFVTAGRRLFGIASAN